MSRDGTELPRRTGPPSAVNVQAARVSSQLQELGVGLHVTAHVGDSLYTLALSEALLQALVRVQILERDQAADEEVEDAD